MNERKKNKSFIDYGRVPPQAVDLEEYILGSVMQFEALPDMFIKLTNPLYFYKEQNRIIAECIVHIIKEQKLFPDIIVVTDYLRKINKLEEVGSAYYISEIYNKVSGSAIVNFDYWCKILHQYWMNREVIRISSEMMNKAYNYKSDDIFDLIKSSIRELEATIPQQSESINTTKSIGSAFNEIFAKNTGQVKAIYEIGSPAWDRIVGLGSSITMIAACGKTGKSSFSIWLMKALLKIHHEYVSIMWVVIDHETAGSIMRKFISNELRIDDERLLGRGNKLTEDELQLAEQLQPQFSKYDIIFEEEQTTIEKISEKFIDFCKKRKNRFNILLIDNIMKLTNFLSKKDNSKSKTEEEDRVANIISNTFNQTRKWNSQIIFLHHINDKDEDIKEGIKTGFRPMLNKVRGSTNLANVTEQTILLHRPARKDALLANYPEYKKILKHLFIVDVANNSFGKEGLIYFWTKMEYCNFKEINCINEFIYKNIEL